MSPILAVFTREPPKILITKISRAPELSATFKRLSCWITVCDLLSLLDRSEYECFVSYRKLDNNCFFNDF
ncbi:hypothetical protein FC48_GL000226 [Ligilactobacillus murinus DSM 20452 = NBRC 14221]|uniref:Uncharacterized protein n=1 Tax=Ligilactobacillus murinus DSM 20452 = NBRC 14221 TaxID=1423772 RepID=A0A0R2B7Y6_9LACO|nr:hypothetical protein FC48_GL000226 [Ligilactobacillus murinus DSM 20452 = NBRC 14221]